MLSAGERNEIQEKMWVATLDRMTREDPCEEIMYPQQNDGVTHHFQMQLASFSVPRFSDGPIISVRFWLYFCVKK